MNHSTDKPKRRTGQDYNSSAESVQDTISRLRRNSDPQKSTHPIAESSGIRSITQTEKVKSRTPKNIQPLPASERTHKINQVIKRLLTGELTQGLALKELRMEVLGLKQDSYAKMVGVSRKTISEIENDKGVFKTDIIDKVFRPFGLKVGLVPISASILSSAFNDFDE